MKFLWTTIHTNNLLISYDFYTNAVGLKEVRRIESPNEMEIVFLGEEGTQIELIYNPNSVVEALNESISIGFQVESVDDKIKQLAEMGINVYEGPKQPNPHIKFFYVLDPNGLKVQFVQVM